MLMALSLPQTLSETDYAAIRYLNLSYKGLRDLPEEIRYMHNLEELIANNNQLSHLSARMIYCKKIKRLELASNNFLQVPSMLSQFPELEHLGMEDNHLSNLPWDLRRLPKLKSLDISNLHPSFSTGYNSMEKVPEVVPELQHLEKLLMERLPLRRLPPEFTKLQDLRILSLSGNMGMDWKQVFQILSHMPKLEVLNISFSGRSYLPPEIYNLKNLKLLIWKEEYLANKEFAENLRKQLPKTRILYGGTGEQVPFLRNNSLEAIRRSY